MPATSDRRTIKGSDRAAPLHGASIIGPIPNDERFGVTVRVRRKTALTNVAANGLHTDQAPAKRKYLERESYAAKYGAAPLREPVPKIPIAGKSEGWARAPKGQAAVPAPKRITKSRLFI